MLHAYGTSGLRTRLYLSAKGNAWQQLRDTLPAALGVPDEDRAPE